MTRGSRPVTRDPAPWMAKYGRTERGRRDGWTDGRTEVKSFLEDERPLLNISATYLPLVDYYIPRQSKSGRMGAVQWRSTPHISAIYEFMEKVEILVSNG